jgi:hypothetical protein
MIFLNTLLHYKEILSANSQDKAQTSAKTKNKFIHDNFAQFIFFTLRVYLVNINYENFLRSYFFATVFVYVVTEGFMKISLPL